ncbi:Uncharacterised protein [Salmonella enterica subsp. houtenae]|nr:Uncharacterised protein [Salmonella enterica subsp. houtenae]
MPSESLPGGNIPEVKDICCSMMLFGWGDYEPVKA